MAVIILRARRGASADPNVRVSARDVSPSDLSIEVAAPSEREMADLPGDPSVIGLAPPMPMALIAPVHLGGDPVGEVPAVSWGIEAVGAAGCSWSGEGVTVAVLDTGIDPGHEAFKNVRLVEADFTGEGKGDWHGHGTHCAGTIFGRDVGGTRIGVARGVGTALIGKVLNRHGAGTTDQIMQGVLWAVQSGAHVLSMSIGIDFSSYVKQLMDSDYPHYPDVATSIALKQYRATVRLFDRLAEFVQGFEGLGRGCVMVAAAGNESRRHLDANYRISTSLPAEADGVISVAAVQKGVGSGRPFVVAPFSNTYARVAAPGVGIWSAQAGEKTGLCPMDGTSMAAPHVAGVAALWAQWLQTRQMGLKASNVTERLLGSTEPGGFSPADIATGVVTAPN